ncbi:transmembrane protein 220-like [Uloborus diversus]|uniref:transmembrane protein 220-like n=1 Tax=Uloborus diversus TaxID=327109 RepID=UPI002408FEAE|nr:transmembrane protein 220-like [Uloborus diversus]
MAEGNKVDAYEVIELQDANSADIDAEENQLQLMAKSAQKERVAQKDGRVVWRGANVMMVIFFVMAAGVQFNDPDPYLWVPLYGVAALLTACVAVRPFLTNVKVWQLGYWMHTIYCIGMFFYVFVELVIAATNPQSDGSLNPLTYEEGRELAGVMITTIWMFICKQSPAIRCIFPPWCHCRKSTTDSLQQQNSVDVFMDMGKASLLLPGP